jgi:hypothetical protein
MKKLSLFASHHLPGTLQHEKRLDSSNGSTTCSDYE